MSLYQAVDNLFNLLWFLIVLRILLSWFPDIDWWKQPFKLLYMLTEPILEPFRKLIPPINGLDISPIFAFLVINIVQTVILKMM